MSSGFTTNGSTPQDRNPFSGIMGRLGNAKTAVGNALNKAGQGITDFRNAVNTPPKPPQSVAPQAPTTPISTQTHKNPDGTVITTKYDTKQSATPVSKTTTSEKTGSNSGMINSSPKPSTGYAQSDPNRIVNQTTGQTAGQAATGTASTTPNFTPPKPDEPVKQKPPETYSGLATESADTARGNTDIGNRIADTAERYGGAIRDVGQKSEGAQIGYLTSGLTSPVAQGLAGNVARSAAAQQTALSAGEEAALKGTGQLLEAQQQKQQGLLGTAQMTPEALRYGGTEGSSVMGNSIDNAVNMIKEGATTQDAMANIIGGDVGANEFIKRMKQFDPNWNPTSSNSIAVQNMKQGQLYQEQAVNLDTGLKQLDLITPTAIDFLNKSGLNSQENPFFNKSVNEYIGQLKNPADIKILNALMGDIKKYTAQILGATGEINPTRIGEINDTFDPSELNAQQLTSFLESLKTLGVNQLSVLQGQASKSYGGGTGYQGGTAIPNTSLNTTPENSPSPLNTDNPVLQGLIGGAKRGVGSIVGFAKSILD